MGAKEVATVTSGVLGFLIPTYFAWTLYKQSIPQNVASWSMVLLLDFVGLILIIKAGNKKPYLQAGWFGAALCIVLAILVGKSPWQWGMTESISLAFCGAAIVLWLTMSARIGVWAYMAAMYISFVPQMVDFWHKPEPDTLWLWCWTIGTCLLAIYGAPKRDFANIFVPWAAILLNVIIAVLCAI